MVSMLVRSMRDQSYSPCQVITKTLYIYIYILICCFCIKHITLDTESENNHWSGWDLVSMLFDDVYCGWFGSGL